MLRKQLTARAQAKQNNRILNILFPDGRAEILRILFGPPLCESHGRELARLTTLALRTVQKELQTLSAAGILSRRAEGTRRLYRPNRDHPLFSALRRLILKGADRRPFFSQHKRPRRLRRWPSPQLRPGRL
jgi:DNA-binding transcriptional ArsR family regulator